MTSKLRKTKLAELIEPMSIRNIQNSLGVDKVMGMTITKELIPTKADVGNTDLSKFLIVKPNWFVMNPRTHGKKIGLAFNDSSEDLLISWNNITFKVKSEELILPRYLYIFFKRSEWDREATFRSWGSSTEVFSFETLCDMEINLPSIDIQKKYVDVYESLLNNLHILERNLDDFYNVSEIFLMKLKEKYKPEPIGPYIFEKNERNKKLEVDNVEGVKKDKTFIPTIANMSGIELSNYKIVRKGDFAYSNRINIGSIALKKEGECVVSPSYTVFGVKEGLLPEYLLMWFCRENFLHYAFFYSMGTVKDELDFKELSNMPIPIPTVELQKEAVKLSSLYFERAKKIETIKKIMNKICSILIRGSILEAKGGEANAN